MGGVVARFAPDLDPDSCAEIDRLSRELEQGRRITQPRLRYRLQVDTIGLNSVEHRLVSSADRLHFEFDDRGAPAQQILAAVYAAGALEPAPRRQVMETIRRALRWSGGVGPDLVAALSGVRSGSGSFASIADPRAWALDRLGFAGTDVSPSAREVHRRYRERLRDVHPDHGALADGAAERIAELAEARRLLIGR